MPGLTENATTRIYNSLIKYKVSHTIIACLFEHGFTTRDILLIYNKYKDNTKAMIKSNCYFIFIINYVMMLFDSH